MPCHPSYVSFKHGTSYNMASPYLFSCWLMLHCVLPVTSRHVKSRHVASCQMTLRCVVASFLVFCAGHFFWLHFPLYHIISPLCSVVLCLMVFLFFVLHCCVMLCPGVLYLLWSYMSCFGAIFALYLGIEGPFSPLFWVCFFGVTFRHFFCIAFYVLLRRSIPIYWYYMFLVGYYAAFCNGLLGKVLLSYILVFFIVGVASKVSFCFYCDFVVRLGSWGSLLPNSRMRWVFCQIGGLRVPD